MFAEMYVRAYCVRIYVVYIKVDVPRRSLKKKLDLIRSCPKHIANICVLLCYRIFYLVQENNSAEEPWIFLRLKAKELYITLPISLEMRQICKFYI